LTYKGYIDVVVGSCQFLLGLVVRLLLLGYYMSGYINGMCYSACQIDLIIFVHTCRALLSSCQHPIIIVLESHSHIPSQLRRQRRQRFLVL